MREISAFALDRLTKPWECFVPYPYDDKRPGRRVDGRWEYPEYAGGPLRGTLTQGYGHTDAAGGPRIELGSRWSEPYASQVLADDMGGAGRAVERLIDVPLGQHQFDCLDDFTFNAGAGTLQRSTLRRRLNAGDYDCVPEQLMRFVYSRGERMRGLERRRQAEISLWRTPDASPERARVTPADHGLADDEVHCPKATLPPRRPAIDSKSVTAGAGIASTGVAVIARAGEALNQATAPIQQARDNLQQLGIWDAGLRFLSHVPPDELALIAGIPLVALGAFVLYDRWRHLRQEAY